MITVDGVPISVTPLSSIHGELCLSQAAMLRVYASSCGPQHSQLWERSLCGNVGVCEWDFTRCRREVELQFQSRKEAEAREAENLVAQLSKWLLDHRD